MIERQLLSEILSEQKIQLSGCTSDECLVQIGKIANVQQIVAGSVDKVGDLYSITARVIDVETSSVLSASSFDYRGTIESLITEATILLTKQFCSTSGKSQTEYDVESGSSNIWNESIAQKTCKELLENYGGIEEFIPGWDSSKDGQYIEHKFLKTFYLPYDTRESFILLYSTSPGIDSYGCHVCAPAVSIFEFSNANEEWKLTNHYINAFHHGSWGMTSQEQYKVLKIGPDKYGIETRLGYTGTGVSSVTSAIWTDLGGTFSNVFTQCVEENDFGGSLGLDWKAEVMVIPEGKGFYNIQVNSNGNRGNEYFDSKQFYRFDGSKYSLDEFYR